MSKVLKRKRFAVRNVFFLHNVNALLEEAVEKNWQSKHTYAKAVRSLKCYPLLLESPQSCKILEGFGSKTCDYLDSKLNEFANELGVDKNEALNIANDHYSHLCTKVGTKNSKKEPSTTSGSQEKSDTSSTATKSKLLNVNNKSVRVRSSSSKEYVPQPRSGAYALLRALYDDACDGGYGLLKTVLRQAAQKYCDSSMTMPETASSFYTCWSSMSTLINKQLVEKQSSPAIFSLTNEGYNLAAKISSPESLVPNTTCNEDPSCSSSSQQAVIVVAGHKLHEISDSDDDTASNSATGVTRLQNNQIDVVNDNTHCYLGTAPQPSCTLCNFSMSFSYLDENFAKVQSKDFALVKINEDNGFIGFLVSVLYDDLLASALTYDLEFRAHGKLPTGQVAAYLADDLLPQFCTGFCPHIEKSSSLPKSTVSPSVENVKCCSDMDALIVNSSSLTKNASATTAISKDLIVSSSITARVSSVILNDASSVTSNIGNSIAPVTSTLNSSILSDSSHLTTTTSTSSTTSNNHPRNLYSISSDNIDIVLCLDNREHYGMGAVKQTLLPGLMRNKIECDIRVLQVADFLWVARCRETHREAVLGVLVERKRMDDLASSIMDGRFREQKFRLQRCGRFQRILLVEEVASHVRMPASTLQQAITSSHVLDGCVVYQCRTLQDTVLYLSKLTQQLQLLYLQNNRIFDVFDSSQLDDDPLYVTLPVDAILVDFRCFNQQATKSRLITVSETLAKQLMQFRGVTMRKAAAIVTIYPTWRSLKNAADFYGSHFLSSIMYDEPKNKKIGNIISTQVFRSIQ